MSDATRWDERYAAADQVWSVEPNQFVASYCEGLPPGRAVDLAAGEGRNALWLASLGWDATAVDFSAVGLERAGESAKARNLEVELVPADLRSYVPEAGAFDLVLIAYLHLPAEDREVILRNAAAAVAPGGTFFLVGHDLTNIADGHGGPQDPSVLSTPDEVAALVSPPLVVSEAKVVARHVTVDGEPKTALDTIVVATQAG